MSVILFIAETLIVLCWVPSPNDEMTGAPAEQKTEKEMHASKWFLHFPSRLSLKNPFVLPLSSFYHQAKRNGVASSNSPFVLYITFLLLVDSINKGFGSIKVLSLS